MTYSGSPYTWHPANAWASGHVETFGAEDADQINSADPLWFQMAPHWATIRAVMEGTEYLKRNAETYLPQQPMELAESWQGRVSRSVFSPYFQKILRVAVGLILRKPIFLEGGDEAYWEEWREDVCRDGSTDLDQFAWNLMTNALAFGHSSILVDYPDTSNVKTLADETEAALKPYLVELPCTQVIGWRHDPRENMGKLQQLRVREAARVPKGRFGVEYKSRVRVLEPGSYEVWEAADDQGAADWKIIESGSMSVKDIPVCTVYGQKEAVMYSKPPLLPLAALNISHYQKASDLTQSLHIAAQPILVMKGMDDLQNDNTTQGAVGLSVNNAILSPPDSEVYYVQPQAGAFDAQRADMDRLVEEMRNLGIAMLSEQNTTNASGVSKALDRIDSNSVLQTISKSLQQCLQDAVNIAAEYAGVEPCDVTIPRDFDVDPITGQDATAINTLFTSGLIDHETSLEMLQHGEFLPDDVDISEVLSKSENDELHDIDMQVQRTEAMAEINEGTPAENEAGQIDKAAKDE